MANQMRATHARADGGKENRKEAGGGVKEVKVGRGGGGGGGFKRPPGCLSYVDAHTVYAVHTLTLPR